MLTVGALLVAIGFIVIATARLGIHAWLALFLAALGFGVAAGLPPLEVVRAANQGFGNTLGSIGSVVILGGIIGVFLERTGAALQLAQWVLARVGPRHVPAAMAGVGYVVSVPVFCDSGFVVLSPLNRALSARAGVGAAAGAVALALGLYSTHTMVPPTPGPVAAAGVLQADLGLVIALGLAIAAAALVAGWVFAITVAANAELPSSASTDSASRPTSAPDGTVARTPGTLHAALPIVVPLGLIMLGSVATFPTRPLGSDALFEWLQVLGQPTVALLLGAVLACTLVSRFELRMLDQTGWVGDAIAATALILIVTGAGGAFAGVLAKTDIGRILGDALAGGAANWGIFVPFAIAALIKSAQGSSTVSMITTAGICAPLLPVLGLESDVARALTTVAIGAGAMVVSHANDSYFWVVTQFSGMTPQQGFRLHTLGTAVLGTTAGGLVWIASLLLL
jgi:GntP family gluconate:H+ symporter